MEFRNRTKRLRRGFAAIIAILFLGIIAAMAVAMASLTRSNSQVLVNQAYAAQARANAEAGLRFIGWKFNAVTLPTTDVGNIDSTRAAGLWSTDSTNIATSIVNNINSMSNPTAKPTRLKDAAVEGTSLHIYDLYLTGDSKSSAEIVASPKSTGMAQVITVKSIGKYRGIQRIVEMDYLIQKTFLNGVVSRIPVQLGKNTVVEGDILVYANATKNSQAPVLSVDDFLYTGVTTDNPTLHSRMDAFNTWVKANCPLNDNRVSLGNLAALQASDPALKNVCDYNGDGFVDEYDIALQYFDTDADKHVSKSEFNALAPNDPNLFYNIDRGIGKPVNSSDSTRLGYNDGYLDSLDPYAKVRGVIRMNAKASDVTSATGKTIGDVMQGAFISRDGYTPPVMFGYDPSTDPAASITSASFDMYTFLSNCGTSAGSAAHPGVPNPDALRTCANTTVAGTDANGSVDSTLPTTLTSMGTGTTLKSSSTSNGVTTKTYTSSVGGSTATEVLTFTTKTVNGNSVQVLTSVTENVPYGVPDSGRRSTCTRPVFSNQNLRNCVINRGTNPLFYNCTFDGVTFVDGSASMGTDYSKGNNIRFLNCTFTGPIAQGDTQAGGSKAPAPAAYTDYTNSWEFSGATTIDFTKASLVSDSTDTNKTALADLKQRATIMAPQTNIEMGSFVAPGNATCSFQGVVVAGCFDVRGVADIDGTIIVVGGDSTNPQGAAGGGNCTLGYFGPNDSATSPYAVDTAVNGAAYGRVHIRFNPFRTLPDGVNLRVSLSPDTTTWREVSQ